MNEWSNEHYELAPRLLLPILSYVYFHPSIHPSHNHNHNHNLQLRLSLLHLLPHSILQLSPQNLPTWTLRYSIYIHDSASQLLVTRHIRLDKVLDLLW